MGVDTGGPIRFSLASRSRVHFYSIGSSRSFSAEQRKGVRS
ncbi:hypothetical protein [Pasteuria penetrans]|nr:hypothetical protein [Pasteuria penetrans]